MSKRFLLLLGMLLGSFLVWHLMPDAQNERYRKIFYKWAQKISIKAVLQPLLKFLIESLSALYFKAVLLGFM